LRVLPGPWARPARRVLGREPPAVWRGKKATSQVEQIEAAVKEKISSAKASANPQASEEALQELLDTLQQQQASLIEVQKSLTADINEARKGGAPSLPTVTELSKLSPRVRSLQTSLTAEISRIKGIMQKAQQGVQSLKKLAENQEAQKKAEEKDTQEFQDALPAMVELVTAAEDSVESIALMASPLLAEPPEEPGGILKMAMEEIETAAKEGQEKIAEARRQLNIKLTAARKYAPETRKNALAEYSVLQQKLTEAQKKVNPYKSFKKEFSARVEAKKALAEISEKLSAAELEVEKATMSTSAADSGQLSEDEVGSAEEVVKPANQGLQAVLRIIEQRLQRADGAMRDELSEMRDRGNASKKRLDAITAKLKTQRDGLMVQDTILQVTEEVGRAEEAYLKCASAEMPFLKGLEVLPQDESSKAISDSEKAAVVTEKAVNHAKLSIRTKMAESKKYAQEVAKSLSDDLGELQKRLEETAKKLAQFKQETLERKMNALLAEVVDSVAVAEGKVSALSEVCKVFSSEELESVSPEALKEGLEKAAEAEKEAAAACTEARKIVAQKQKEAKGGEAAAAVGKLQTRLTVAQQELAKHKKAAASGEKLIKGKEVLAEEEERMGQAEAEAEKAEGLSNPREDLGEERLSDDRLTDMLAAVESTQKLLKAISTSIGAHMPGAVPVVKAALEKLRERVKKVQEQVNAVLAKTKDQRETVECKNALREAEKKVSEVDVALEEVNKAELPFLKGIEVLPLTLAAETIKESELAASMAQAAISKARGFISTKNLELKNYAEAVSKPAAEDFKKLAERLNAAAAKLSSFVKDTDGRKKTARMQETGEKISAAEEKVKKFVEAAEPLTKESEEPMPDESAFALCETLSALLSEAQTELDAAKVSVASLTKETRNSEAHRDGVKKMADQLAELSSELGKVKKAYAEHDGKYTSKKIVSEASQKIAEAEEELTTIKDKSAPLLEHGGDEFLVQSSTQTLASVLREYAKEKELTEDALFNQINSGGEEGRISQATFLTYLEKLPEDIGRDEVQFDVERRLAMFNLIDMDKDGSVGLSEFKEIFRRRFICVKGISVTDSVEVSKSKTTGKVEPGEVLEAIGEPQKDAATGVMRLECKSTSSELAGFVTMMGNQGTTYLERYMPYNAFAADIDKAVEEGAKSVRQALVFVRTKESELQKLGTKAGSAAAEARAALTKCKAAVTASLNGIDALRKKILAAKSDFVKKEQAEKNAHIEARERKEAAAMMAEASAKMEVVEACAKKVAEAVTPLTAAEGAELEAFATPLSLLDEAEQLLKELLEAASEAKACTKEQQAKIPKATKGPLLDARKDLHKIDAKVAASVSASKNSVEAVREKCSSLVEAKFGRVSSALRGEVEKRGITLEKLFEELAGSAEDCISEEGFCAHMASLEGFDLSAEHVKLVFRKVEKGGIGRRKFLGFLQQYFTVVKSIAFTNDFDVGKAKTIRKAETEEIIEVLDGPRTDAKLGLTRVRGRSLADLTEGWVSVVGNQGTPFLQETEKPFYTPAQEVKLLPEFKIDGQEPVRTCKPDEVLELVEGPRKEAFEPALRVRGKACSDGAIGWFTVRDKTGVVTAEKDEKFYTCSQSVAMTDNQDIKDCKVIRKLAVGESFTLVEGPIQEGGITRVRAKASKDDQEGWVTTQGNAGTVYASASSKHYCLLQDLPLQKKLSSTSSETIRELAKEEMMQGLEEPKEEASPPDVRIRCKALSDGALGWITLRGENVKRWSPTYKCVKAVPLHDALAAEGAGVVRQLEAGEKVELLQGPAEEGSDLRMKARAEKDGATGWATIRDGEGKRFLQSVA